jgi:hypothetical protein
MTVLGRLAALAVSLACFALLLQALRLVPSPTGLGTHTQMGLQPCYLITLCGLPCPTCGMTTSFAWFARGNIAASFYVQPMGCVLAVLTVVTFWTGLYIAATGRAAYRSILFIPARYYILPLLGWALAAWGWKIFIHTSGIDGWHA